MFLAQISGEIPWDLLNTENGIWVLVLMVIVREWANVNRNKNGPAWISNGAMDSVLAKFTLRFQDVLREQQIGFANIPAKNEKLLNRLTESVKGFESSHIEIASKLDSCGKHLEEMMKVQKAVVRELNATRNCPYNPADAEGIARELQRKRKADAHTRAEDLGLDE